MNIYLEILWITVLTGVGGLALGGLAAVLIHNSSDRQMSLLLRFTAGVMLSVVCFDLVADAREEMGVFAVIAWIAGGYLATYLLNCWIDAHAHHSHHHGHEEHQEHEHHHEHDEHCCCGHDHEHHHDHDEHDEHCTCGCTGHVHDHDHDHDHDH